MFLEMTTCKTCKKEVAKSAAVCPHCGARLRMGTGKKIFLGVFGVIFVIVGLINFGLQQEEASTSEEASKLAKSDDSVNVSDLQPCGELAEMFRLGSDYTNVQREEKLKEISGKIIKWTLPVYEISKGLNDVYSVRTQSPSSCVDVNVSISTTTASERDYLSKLKTGDMITFKGKISGTGSFRRFNIEPAVLILPANETLPPKAEQRKALPQAEETNSAKAGSTDSDESVQASPPDGPVNLEQEYAKVDGELNAEYKKIMMALNAESKTALKKEQIAWIKEKERNCKRGTDDGVNSSLNCSIMMTKQRLAILESTWHEINSY